MAHKFSLTIIDEKTMKHGHTYIKVTTVSFGIPECNEIIKLKMKEPFHLGFQRAFVISCMHTTSIQLYDLNETYAIFFMMNVCAVYELRI